MKLAISSGHGKLVRGASGVLDEVDEARRVVSALCDKLFKAGHEVTEIHDDTSTTQDENLDWLVTQHNRADRELDISVHFNAYEQTSGPMGVEVLYVTQQALADKVSQTIAQAGGLIDRGPKYRDNLYFLNNTDEPAILIETCFCDSVADAELYEENFDAIINALAKLAGGIEDLPESPPPERPKVYFSGPCSWFGGPEDGGVSPSEGLAFIYEYEERPDLFLDEQPPGTTGLARRLNADEVFYVACRWDYDVTPKTMLADHQYRALVRANGQDLLAWPADWGPHSDTGRAADLSPALMDELGLRTDDLVEVVYPAPAMSERPERPPLPDRPPAPAVVDVQITSSGPVSITVNGAPIGEV